MKDIVFQDSILEDASKSIDIETKKIRIELMRRKKCPFCFSDISKEDIDEIIMFI